MEAGKRLDSLHLDHDRVSDQEIEPVAGFQREALVGDRKSHLPPYSDPPQLELMCEAMLIGRLEKTGPEGPVNLQTGVNDMATDVLDLLRDPFVVFAPFVVQS